MVGSGLTIMESQSRNIHIRVVGLEVVVHAFWVAVSRV